MAMSKLNIQTSLPPLEGMASNHGTPPGLGNMGLWNDTQEKMREELAEAGEPTLDAFLMASFTFKGGVYQVSITGGATRDIGEGHPAYAILAKKGSGSGGNLNQAIRMALGDR